MRRSPGWRALALATFVLLAVDLTTWSGVGLRRSPSPSLAYRLFFVRWVGEPRLFDYVSFCAPPKASEELVRHGYPLSPRCDPPAVSLVKQIVALNDGKAHVRGHHPDSYDSRQLGDIPVADLTPLIPLF